MDHESELTRYIIARLGRAADHDDLVTEVCLRTGMDWEAGEEWIAGIARDHSKQVARRQTPWIIALCGGAGIGGLALAWSAFFAMGEPLLAYYRIANPAAVLFSYAAVLWYFLPQFLGGVGLAAGGTIGLIRLWQRPKGLEETDSL